MIGNTIVKTAGLSNLQKRVLVGAGLTAVPFYLKAKNDRDNNGNPLSSKQVAARTLVGAALGATAGGTLDVYSNASMRDLNKHQITLGLGTAAAAYAAGAGKNVKRLEGESDDDYSRRVRVNRILSSATIGAVASPTLLGAGIFGADIIKRKTYGVY